jgi:ABC-type transport system substrate-binding protein
LRAVTGYAAIAALVLIGVWQVRGRAGRNGAVLRVGLPAPMGGLDPHRRHDTGSMAQRLVYRPLFRISPDGALESELVAEHSWNADRTQLAIELRDARFHDGAPITAAIVIDSLRAKAATGDGSFAREMAGVTSMRALGPRSLSIVLARPSPLFFEELEVGIRRPGPADPGSGSGAYRIERAEPHKIVLTANVSGSLGYERIELVEYQTTAELWKQLLAGSIDVVPLMTAEAHGALGRYPWIDRWAATTSQAIVLRWAPRWRAWPQLIAAVDKAIDRNAMVERLGNGALPLASRTDRTLKADFDPMGAAALLRSLELPGSLRLAAMGEFSEFDVVALHVERDLGNAGITVMVSRTQEQDAAEAADADLLLTMGRISPHREPTSKAPETVLYHFVAHGAARAGVCGLETRSLSTVVSMLDRAHPCAAPREGTPTPMSAAR